MKTDIKGLHHAAYRCADLRLEVSPGDDPQALAERAAERLEERACAT